MNVILPIAVLLAAAIISVVYLLKWPNGKQISAFGGDRPWRRVGAVICLVVAIMFVVGASQLNATASPRTFILYWIVILVLVLWLCGLALKDVLHTRATIARWRAGKTSLNEPSADRSRELNK